MNTVLDAKVNIARRSKLQRPKAIAILTGARNKGLDMARALAIFIMVLVNFKVNLDAADAGPGWLVWITGLFDGRAAATFVILAGMGISLLSRSGKYSDIRHVREIILTRAALFFICGLFLRQYWESDILHFYGIYFLLGALFLNASSRTLLLLTGIAIACFPVLHYCFDFDYGLAFFSLGESYWTDSDIFTSLAFNGTYPLYPWIAFFIFGMWLGRKNLQDPSTWKKLVFYGVVCAILAEISSLVFLDIIENGDFGLSQAMLASILLINFTPPMPLFMVSAGATACAVIGFGLLIERRFAGRIWFKSLACAGRLALTLYFAHIIVGLGILRVLDRGDGQTLVLATCSAAVFCIVSVVFANIWSKFFPHGPCEWVLRRAAIF
ncbi:DUF418 domain-containing protein [Elusimicrobiota bacterium]